MCQGAVCAGPPDTCCRKQVTPRQYNQAYDAYDAAVVCNVCFCAWHATAQFVLPQLDNPLSKRANDILNVIRQMRSSYLRYAFLHTSLVNSTEATGAISSSLGCVPAQSPREQYRSDRKESSAITNLMVLTLLMHPSCFCGFSLAWVLLTLLPSLPSLLFTSRLASCVLLCYFAHLSGTFLAFSCVCSFTLFCAWQDAFGEKRGHPRYGPLSLKHPRDLHASA